MYFEVVDFHNLGKVSQGDRMVSAASEEHMFF
jgi:hypothetical protein